VTLVKIRENYRKCSKGTVYLTFGLLIGSVLLVTLVAAPSENLQPTGPSCDCRSLEEIAEAEETELCAMYGYKKHGWASGFVNIPRGEERFVCINDNDWELQMDPPRCNTRDLNSCIDIRNTEHAAHEPCEHCRTTEEIIVAEEIAACGERLIPFWTTRYPGRPYPATFTFVCANGWNSEHIVPERPKCNRFSQEECEIIQRTEHLKHTEHTEPPGK
jgi:hypothetical protein